MATPDGKPSKVANEILSSVNDLSEAVDALARQFDAILQWQTRLDNRLTNLHDKVDIIEARMREIHQHQEPLRDDVVEIKYDVGNIEKIVEKFSGVLNDVEEVLDSVRRNERKEWMTPNEVGNFKLIRTG